MPRRSQDEVFDTAELLEYILIDIDLVTLLTSAQLVRRRWREVISDSPPLQRRLFFRGIPQPAANTSAADGPGGGQEVNPLLKEKFDIFFYEPEPDEHSLWQMRSRLFRSSIRRRYFPPDFQSQMRTINLSSFSGGRRCLALANEWRRDAFMRPGASWRRMLVAQPPRRLIGFMEEMDDAKWGSSERGRYYRCSELRLSGDNDDDDDGLRMGELYDAATSWVMRHQRCGIVWKPAALPLDRTFQQNLGAATTGAADLAGRADLILRLEKSGTEVVSHTDADRVEEVRRAQDEFSRVFVHPDARGKPPVFETPSLRWRRCDADGNEIVEG
ncbi:hypothetical protein PG994_013648 [Apiospora phragmitis]|uniref:F-box domain-containing protein n=1 Tax=Apiospora phragmitis TaxID=2905665 RepID=A0ABR1T992_9PEZI